MAKLKKKLSEHVNNKKRNNASNTQNPFEIHINKQKYEILGRKLKNDRGLPGVSRANAIKKRKYTLLQEYNLQNKSNKFVDRRIGERNFSLTEEDRKMARYTAERMKHHKKSIFNLADNEVLTHRGQTLSEIEKFDDPRSDDDDEGEYGNKTGKLNDSFVDDAHFGGGILQKTGKEGAKTHKDLIEQLIAESKKRKAEKQKTREQTIELTEKLDTEWKDLIPLVSKSKKDDVQTNAPEKPDDYDKLMRELKFEARGKPTDRLKSEEEIAREEKEKLENLEMERLERMEGFKKSNTKSQHRSADDLDDNFAYESDTEVTLAYNEMGECNIDLTGNTEYAKDLSNKDDKDKESESEESGSNEENDDDSSDGETEDDLSDLKESETDSDLENNNSDNSVTAQVSSNEKTNKYLEIVTKEKNTNTSKTSQTKTVVHKTSIKETETKSNKRKNEAVAEDNANITKKKAKSDANSNENKSPTVPNKIVKIKEDEHVVCNQNKSKKTSKSKMDKGNCNQSTKSNENDQLTENDTSNIAQDLPYTFVLPDSYETLQTLLDSQSPERQNVIIERTIKCNHPSLAATNKENLGKLFIYLLQHINDVAHDSDNVENTKFCFSVMNNLTPHLYTLAQLNPQNAHESLMEVLTEKQNDYRRKPKEYPKIDVLLFLKLIGCLFSTSDFRHQVVTPAITFMGQMLTNCRVKNRYDVAYGLFLVTLFIEYTALSKRYLPAALIFSMGILHMAIPKVGVRLLKIIPPFKSNSTLLVLSSKQSKPKSDLKMSSKDFVIEEIDENFRQRALHITINLIQDLYEHWKNIPSSVHIFDYVLNLLQKIPLKCYCKEIQTNIDQIKDILENGKENKKLEYIVAAKKRPKALRLYEPNIQKVYDEKQHRPMSRERAEREKLLHKYKREMKGALREIRRDKSFLGRLKIKQQIQSDHERREKVKQIYSEASLQQGELNALDRKKKRK